MNRIELHKVEKVVLAQNQATHLMGEVDEVIEFVSGWPVK